mmetsp:Transcript_6849/g.12134  ORF Transcript_6849/g.12134 Transcript_6849/m.12134 type:complete len:606 (+) Transcript_6849:378-2195(+)
MRLCWLQVARVFWLESGLKTQREAWCSLCAVLALQVVRGKMATVVSDLTRRQLNALGGSKAGFVRTAIKRAAVVLLLIPIEVVYDTILRGLKTEWSKHLTDILLKQFVKLNSFNLGQPGVEVEENLDQRVAEDVDKYVDLVLDLFLEIMQAAVHLFFFTRVLWGSSKRLSKLTILLSFLGTGGVLYVGRSLPAKYQEERKASNFFRYALTRVRENAESIAFYDGEDQEVRMIRKRHLIKEEATWARKSQRIIVEATSRTYRKIMAAVPFLIASATYKGKPHEAVHMHNHGHNHGHNHSHNHGVLYEPTNGMHDFATIMQASGAFDEIMYHLMIIAENLNDFSRLKTVSEQLFAMISKPTCAGNVTQNRIQIQESNGMSSDTSKPWLLARNLRVVCKERCLIDNLSFELERGSKLLITGESGVGKTTLLRSIQGLYTYGSGSIERPTKRNIAFVPQQPYMTLGSLRDQLLYPEQVGTSGLGPDEETLMNILADVGLGHIAAQYENGLDAVSKWSEELSIGEQQRLAFARILVHKPEFCFLDEATSALDLDLEAKMYHLVNSNCTSVVSVGHRKSIEVFHDVKLCIKAKGSWTLSRIRSGHGFSQNY